MFHSKFLCLKENFGFFLLYIFIDISTNSDISTDIDISINVYVSPEYCYMCGYVYFNP